MRRTSATLVIVALLLTGCIETETDHGQAELDQPPPGTIPMLTASLDTVVYAPGTLPCLGLLWSEGWVILPKGAVLASWTYAAPTEGADGVTTVYQLEWQGPVDRAMSHAVISPVHDGTMRLRVAEIDAQGRMGEWSEWGMGDSP